MKKEGIYAKHNLVTGMMELHSENKFRGIQITDVIRIEPPNEKRVCIYLSMKYEWCWMECPFPTVR